MLYTPEAEALRSTLREAFGWADVNAGEGWLIFALPPAELGVHPGETAKHERSFMCDDVQATLGDLEAKGVEAWGEPHDMGFGVGTTVVLPGGVEVLLYEPRHPSPPEQADLSGHLRLE